MNKAEAKSKQTRRECGRNPVTGTQIRIGVMGSATDTIDPELAVQCRRLGRVLAEEGCCVLTGACPGMPHEVVVPSGIIHLANRFGADAVCIGNCGRSEFGDAILKSKTRDVL